MRSNAAVNLMTFTKQRRQLVLYSTVCASAGLVTWYHSSARLEDNRALDKTKSENDTKNNPIEINLMEKIANKTYLNPTQAILRKSKQYHHYEANHKRAIARSSTSTQQRPPGVPSTFRLLAIDLPEMRTEAFKNGTCRIAFDKVYPNGVAPPKYLEVNSITTSGIKEDKGDSKREKRQGSVAVEQKAFVRSMMRCYHSTNDSNISQAKVLGVELMEASIANLNPRNLRKTRQVGAYHYDPGKYSTSNGEASNRSSSRQQGGASKNKPEEEEYQQVQEDDELEAPWNQYAWKEEIKFRIYGLVPFGDSLEAASRWERYFTGHRYKQTISSERPLWELLLPPFLQTNPDGIDGGGFSSFSRISQGNNNWASNKPHAVIANGAAIQRVPSALRMLQQTCREANVPLFVINDYRKWGGNTHEYFQQALFDMRFLVKEIVISQAMEQQSGFSRGRLVGRLEKQIEHFAEQACSNRQRGQEAIRIRRWDELGTTALEKRLMEHGVLRREERGTVCTPAMVEVARQCVADEEDRKESRGVPFGSVDADDGQMATHSVSDEFSKIERK